MKPCPLGYFDSIEMAARGALSCKGQTFKPFRNSDGTLLPGNTIPPCGYYEYCKTQSVVYKNRKS